MNKQSLRHALLKRRQSLSAYARQQAAASLCAQCRSREDFTRSQTIGVYLTDGFELDLTPLIQLAWTLGKACYLPCVFAGSAQMSFVEYAKTTVLVRNKYNMLQPKVSDSNEMVTASTLDLIFMPCVGIDKQHNRLGRGAGYYDKTCADISNVTTLIAVAFHTQCVDNVYHEPHDVPCDVSILV